MFCGFSVVPVGPADEGREKDYAVLIVEGKGDDLAALRLPGIELRFGDVVLHFLLSRSEEIGEQDVEVGVGSELVLFPVESDFLVELHHLVAVLLVVVADAVE